MLLSDSSLTRLQGASRVLCAVSGGADSMCLLYQLFVLSETMGFELIALHFNHKLRAAADAEERFVQAWCAARGIRFYSDSGDVSAYAREQGLGTEEAARKLRYDFFERMAAALNADLVTTAHNADDNLETVLMHLVRGSGLKGLCGIPESRGIYLRPLLQATRAEIERELAEHGIPHVEDESNAEPVYTRNRIRLEIVPLLRALNPNVSETVLASCRSLTEDEACLTGAAQAVLARCAQEAHTISFTAAELSGLPRAVASRVLRMAAEQLGYRLSRVQTEAVLELACAASPSAWLTLDGELRAERCYERLRLTDARPVTGFEPRPVAEGQYTRLEPLGLTLYCGELGKLKKIHRSFQSFCFKKSAICGNMTVRPRKSGDWLRLGGRNCTKTLKKLFVEEKVPRQLRACMPVLADERGVLAVFGLSTSGIVPDERVLCREEDEKLWIAWWED